ncbi:Rrf2 family transcriptional regulator [uncultured Nisaea sp.]|uniref:RrF2 family transcriptional regulator n=1 Tax=uncultured Nisaea sp. TaxID=538215 RepID=UPI0030EC956C
MKFSTKGRYAVMAVCDLARHDDGRPVSLAEIASRQKISVSYLEQMFAQLRKARFVKSVRGPGGGYLLAIEPSQIKISDVMTAIEHPVRGNQDDDGMFAARGCSDDPTKPLWEEVGRQVLGYLDKVTVEDLMSGRVPH